MSVHSRFDNPTLVGRLETAPIVLRFASLFPRDLKRREMHDKRTGGDLTHIRTDMSHLNTQLVGGPDWIERLHAEIATAMENNHEEEIAARQRKGRFLEAERLCARGPVDPWKFTREGPLREGIITVNKHWFGGIGHESWDPERVEAFKQRANDFLLEHFPDRQLREANIDQDEEALHIHFAVAVWVEKVSQNRGHQWLLQPSANPLLANYEYAQDVAGTAFLDLGIHRGERRAAAARQALAAGLEAPEPRRHIPPSEWRREQRRLAIEDRYRIRAKTQAEAATTIADGVALAKAVVKKSRTRAIKEAKTRKAETDRQVAAAERDRARAEALTAAARAGQETAEAARREADWQAEAARVRSAWIIGSAENRAAVIISDTKLMGTKALKQARKRAAREVQALRDEVRRMKADTDIELRRGQLAAAFVRGRTARLQERTNSLSRDIETKAKIWTDRERQHRKAEFELAQIEQDRAAAEAAVTQAQDNAAGILAAAEARGAEARQAQEKAYADRVDAERLAVAAREEASRITQASENWAGAIVAGANTLATVTLRKSRKRSVAEATVRRAKADRAAAAAERERQVAEARAERARQAHQAAREAAEDAVVSARAEAVGVRQVAEVEADRIRTEAMAFTKTEQARADAALQARNEAEAGRLAANQAAAEVIGTAEVERAEAARAMARAEVVTAGLAALTQEMTAGTLSLQEDGRVNARAPDLLRPAYPEIKPAVQAVATAAEKIRAARREADVIAWTADDARNKAAEDIASDRAAAEAEIERARNASRAEIESEREAVTTDLDGKRAELERQEAEVKKQWAFLASLLERFEPLPKKVMRWLSSPDLPASLKEEGIDLVAEGLALSRGVTPDDPAP